MTLSQFGKSPISDPAISQCRRGTVLVFLLGAMTIVSVLLHSLVRIGEAPGTVATAREVGIAANAMALSGIDIMASIASYPANGGPTFLQDRQRRLTPGTPYDRPSLFGLQTGSPNAYRYTPPVEYPPLTNLSLRNAPVNGATLGNNDIRLPSDTQTLSLPANVWLRVPNSNYTYPSGNESAILPSPGFLPVSSDLTYNTGGSAGLALSGTSWVISALYPSPATLGISWWGPKNDATGIAESTPVYMPSTQIIVGENPSFPPAPALNPLGCDSKKMPPPSFIVVKDIPGVASAQVFLRAFMYAWYVRSETSSTAYYYMTSGRIWTVNAPIGGAQSLGSEIAVSATQFR